MFLRFSRGDLHRRMLRGQTCPSVRLLQSSRAERDDMLDYGVAQDSRAGRERGRGNDSTQAHLQATKKSRGAKSYGFASNPLTLFHTASATASADCAASTTSHRSLSAEACSRYPWRTLR